MNVEKYLARIGMESTGAVPDFAHLKLLQRQHLLNVPFENLDIHWNTPIYLDTGAFYRKIVDDNRGGFCYELNGLFNELLRELGFETRLLSARVADLDGNCSPEFDHAAILVIIGEMQYLADVGFGSFTAEPLQFVPDFKQQDPAGEFIIRRHDPEYFSVAKQVDFGWKTEYLFKPLGHDLSEFEERCEWHQTSPESHFRQGKLCSLMTLNGRKTLTDEKFIVTNADRHFETPVTSESEFTTILLREFGISRSESSQAYSLADQFIQ
jgi:N-hydroxyarylamine O-acetyltransferase